jgi:hypothetical protein
MRESLRTRQRSVFRIVAEWSPLARSSVDAASRREAFDQAARIGSARQIPGTVVKRTKRIEDLIDGDRCLQSIGRPQRDGYDAIAEASDAQDSRMARLSARVRPG